ncbi:hypothetical protein JGU66_34780 [Myxococcaceae bacterium JPH2]|nr:hypothetical protein [Myxococcaceae bacterium JPH2]
MDAAALEEFLQRVGREGELEWAQGRTLAEVWRESPSGFFLIQLAVEAGMARRRVMRALFACVRPMLKYTLVEGPSYEPLDTPCMSIALDVAEAWAQCIPGAEFDAVKELAVQAKDAANVVDCMQGYAQTPYAPGAVSAALAISYAMEAACEESASECLNKVGWARFYSGSATAAQHGYSEESRREFDETCARVVRELIRAEDVATAAENSQG